MTFTSSPLGLLLRKLAARSPLAEGDRQAILALPYTRKTVEAQSYIRREGNSSGAFPILVSGFAYQHKQTSDGARQIVGLHIPGEPLDLQNLFLDAADHSVQTLTQAELLMIPRVELEALIRTRPAIACAFLALAVVEAAALREWVLNIGRRDAAARLAHFLCELADRLEAEGLADADGFDLPMTQEQLSDALGLTPVHLNRTIRALQVQGLIERERRRIRIPEWPLMRDYGDFNRSYLHLAPRRAA